jgi:ParB family transcriptional regulator, chromosome partitioning protein
LFLLSKIFSKSLLVLGIIEDVALNKIKKSEYLQRSPLIGALYDSIKEKGLLQPIIVRPKNDYFEIVAGNRRYEACKKLGWKKIICHIVELDDKEAFEIGLIENIQRKNFDPIDEARSFEIYVIKYGWGGISELAEKIGKSTSYVDRRLQLLNLPKDVLDSISGSQVSPTIGVELITLKDGQQQSDLAKLVLQRKLSSREVRNLVKDMKNNSGEINSNDDDDDDELDDLKSSSINIEDIDKMTKRIFDKSLLILKIASSKLGVLVPSIEDNWIIYELLMQNKQIIDNQINILIKEKKKL